MLTGSIISVPNVDAEEVATLLGLSTTNIQVATLCTSAKVNKWSKWKPYTGIAGLSSPTCAQVVAAHMGIDCSGAVNNSFKTACQSVDNTQLTLAQAQQAMASMPGYVYLPRSQNCRLTDFGDSQESATNNPYYFIRSYDHGAKAPDACDDWTISLANAQSAASAALTSSQYSMSNYDWLIKNTTTLITYGAMTLRYGAQSQECVNAAPANAMPLNWILGDAAAGEKWRLGVAVLLPWTGTGTSKPHWVMFTGRMLFTSGNIQSSVGNVLPDLITNITAARELYYNANTKGVTSFDAVPLLVKNSKLGLTGIASNTYISYVDLADASTYVMPSKSIIKMNVALPAVLHKESGTDSTYRWVLWTPLNGNANTYWHIRSRTVTTSGSSHTMNDAYYILHPLGTVTATVAHDQAKNNSTGNMYVSNISGQTTVVQIRTYSSKNDYDNGKAGFTGGTFSSQQWSNCILQYFTVYCGASMPSSVTITIDVQTKAFN